MGVISRRKRNRKYRGGGLMGSTSLPNMCPEILGDPLLNRIKPPEKLSYHLQNVPRATA